MTQDVRQEIGACQSVTLLSEKPLSFYLTVTVLPRVPTGLQMALKLRVIFN
ncbi:hypothetical protein ANCDUO_03428 [Ancylostoma duodenale]|uniref:Uncharacterized protein n=1 Tax=Ancylostoma duodenale TaxID=51022 RepID=A0A0C2GXJ4_9BILA|nr:hypothetical protein ANCDUO_03428 [Ancylostoma duodenale]